jgi:hypothetical protein
MKATALLALCLFLIAAPAGAADDCEALLADDDKLMALDKAVHQANGGQQSMLTMREDILPTLLLGGTSYEAKDALFLYDLSLASGWRFLNLVHLNLFFDWPIDTIAECIEQDAVTHHPDRAAAISLLRETLR